MVFGFAALVAIVVVAGAAVLGTVAAWHFEVRRRWVRWGVASLAIVLGAGATILFLGASHVVRVNPDMTTSEALLIGSTSETVGGREVELSGHGYRTTVIVNRSERTLELSPVVYGPGELWAPPSASVAPLSVYDLDSKLEYIGPDQKPPSEISSKQDREVRYWLTW